jgi:hypothetical protein
MFIPSESEFDIAARRLVEAGFRPATWSYGILDPQLLPDDEISRRINPWDMSGYRMLDNNSVRFQFPVKYAGPERVVLLRSTYVGLSPSTDPSLMQGFSFKENLCYPDAALLLESIIKALTEDTEKGYWQSLLAAWAISYIYGQLMVEDSVLDSCDDEHIKSWFNENIRRGKDGLDRDTITKRAGRRPAKNS